MPTLQTITLASAATTTALMGGLFYAYSCSVNPGLGRLSDVAYLSAMQSINRAILNPVFFVGFMGTAILLPLSTWSHYQQPVSGRFWLLLCASIVYLIGTFGVTILGNVPLNDALDAFSIQTASAEEVTAQRARFEAPWNRLHAIRTVAAVLAVILVIIACLTDRETTSSATDVN
ncbi:anthrone oxygenase family protein [Spirosoma endbachense]|uniref:DUF1772 domain-containing protein n=1 Tax=Spirosoma endbachense TaxID=2666025 RepID=A0A6P1W113_9BACT|nr:anthrone oxygenase family protein [Spirosoma endbachense]QHV99121.1 DUF1772 domain-containing protein [Spirosoma endbachense]